MMSRKNYRAIANLLTAHRVEEGNSKTLDSLTIGLADIFELDNPAFNRERFYSACGYVSKSSAVLECECGVILEYEEITCPNCDEMFSTELEGVR